MKRYLLGLLASGLVIMGLAGTPGLVSASDHGFAQQTVARAAQSGWTRARWYRGYRGAWYGPRYGWRRGWYGPRYAYRGWGYYGRPYRWGYWPYRTYWGPYYRGYYGWPGYYYGGYSVVTPYFGIWW